MSLKDKFGFIGWYNEGTSDKIWGFFYRGEMPVASAANFWSPSIGREVCVFWARRGAKMQFKIDHTGHMLDKLVHSKTKKGYNTINSDKLLEIWPTFIQEAEEKLMWDILSGKI